LAEKKHKEKRQTSLSSLKITLSSKANQSHRNSNVELQLITM